MFFFRFSYIGSRLRPLTLSVMLAFSLGFLSGQAWPGSPLSAAETARPVLAAGADSTPENQKLVCLTFDDGPSKNTPAVLDVLERYGIPATFFVIATGYNDPYLPLISQAQQAGHQVALHSASHDYSVIYASPAAYWEDIDLLRERLTPYMDPSALTWLRFPGGSTNTVSRKYGGSGIMKELKAQAEEKGYHWVDWNVSGEDAAGEKLSPGEIFKNVVRTTNGQSVCVVLLHDSATTSTTPDALPDIIGWYKEQGYEFCTVEELYGK